MYQNTYSSSLDLFAHHSAAFSIVMVGNQIDAPIFVKVSFVRVSVVIATALPAGIFVVVDT
jgi:hypothetical protein